MEAKTEVGKILKRLNYLDSQVERFDNLALHLYSIPFSERDELLGVLMWYCGVMTEDGAVRGNYKQQIERCDTILAEINA